MNKKIILTAVIVTLAALIGFGAVRYLVLKAKAARKITMTAKQRDTVYKYAKQQYLNNEFDTAQKAFEYVVKDSAVDTMTEDALLSLAAIFEAEGVPDKAQTQYKQYMELFPSASNVQEIQKKYEDINISLLLSPVITKGDVEYTIKPGDNLTRIAKQYGTTIDLIKAANRLKGDVIIPGRTLKITPSKFTILVDKSQNILFLKRDGEIIKTYTVSTGTNNSTPTGTFTIEEKLTSPLWYKIGAVVKPDSSDYELGTRWMGLSKEGYGIHGTKEPESIGRQVTRGCVRMVNSDVEELYTIVPSGTEVTIED
ncbi:MAG: L,D-transpeptidase family protein [Candidatus Omnitrophica bacterium]|nr:L,D-transpeptidase family protein [Candidatus Omnitrophota bacterium]